MSSTRSTNTQSEALKGMLGQLADIKTYPDADIEWLLGLETQILQKLRAPVDQAMSASGLGDMPPSPGMAQPGPVGGGSPMPAPQAGPPPGVAGLRTSPSAPNPDELRRLLTQGQ